MSDYAEKLTRNCAILNISPPIDMTAGGVSCKPFSMKHWDHATIIATTGTIVAGTCAITLTQDVSVTPTADVIALTYTEVLTNEAAAASSVLLPVPVVNTDNLAAAGSVYAIEVDADDLSDAAGATTGLRYDCVVVELSAPGNNDLVNVIVILSKGRYTGAPATMKNAYID